MHAYRRLVLSRRFFSSSYRLCSESSSSSSSVTPLPPPPSNEAPSSEPGEATASSDSKETKKKEKKPFVLSSHYNVISDKRNELKEYYTLVNDVSTSDTTSWPSPSLPLDQPDNAGASGKAKSTKTKKVSKAEEAEDLAEEEGKPQFPTKLRIRELVDEWQEAEQAKASQSKYPQLAPGQTPHQSGKNRKTRNAEKLEEKKAKRVRREDFKKKEMIKKLKEEGIEYVELKHNHPPTIEKEFGIDTTEMTSSEIRRLRRRLKRQKAREEAEAEKQREEKREAIGNLEQARAEERLARERKEQSERSKAHALQRKKEQEAVLMSKAMVPSRPKGEWMGEHWTAGWGEDKLAPPPSHFPLASIDVEHPSPSKAVTHHAPPHLTPLTYERKIEGLLSPSKAAVLGGPGGSSQTKPVLQDLEPKSEHNPVATLSHGLDRVLFNPGVHWLQDPRSKVYNFTPYLENIPKATDFAFERIVGFIKSSRDEDLWGLAKEHKRPFAGSTSSLSGMLSHIYFLLSADKPVNTSMLSRAFAYESKTFTPGQRMPATVVFNHNDGHYAIDSAEKGESDKNILTWMGTLLERFMTMPKEEFATYLRKNPPPKELENPLREAYRYSKSEQFVMRSQLDCHDPRLPGTGVFDIKTRACLPIRMDLLNFEENAGYQLRTAQGLYESFEREYYDLIRSAFLKYSFQVRIGNMDGVIVAYHNTEKMFGFQYVPLEEMDEAVFGDLKLRVGAKAAQEVKEKQENFAMRAAAEAADPGADTSQNIAEGVNGSSVPDSEPILNEAEPVNDRELAELSEAPQEAPVSLTDADWKKRHGDRIFEVCVRIMEKVSQEVVGCFPGQSVKATFEKYEAPETGGRAPIDHVMNVWVEPAEWKPEYNQTEQDRPIKQLEVRVTNYFGQEAVKGAKAITEGAGEDWIVHWSVGKLTGTNTDVRGSLKATLDRQFRQMFIPSGVSMAEIKPWWEALNFGGPPKEEEPKASITEVTEVVEGKEEQEAEETALATAREGLAEPPTPEASGKPFDHSVFAHAPKRIRYLRAMARRGREESERIRQEEEASGREKIVYGEEI